MIDISGFLPLVKDAFVDWLGLFASPVKNLDMLWIIVPVWCVWLFSEFFQEKKGTSFGNAITNGAVMLFVGVDWIRYLIRQISSGAASLDSGSLTELVVSGVIIIISIAIILLGIKGHKIVKMLGRVRESTYILVMFTPVIYGVVEFTFRNLFIILAFFPIFYLLIELLDKILPTPRTYDLEEEDNDLGKDAGLADLSFPGTVGGMSSSDFGRGALGRQKQPKGKL